MRNHYFSRFLAIPVLFAGLFFSAGPVVFAQDGPPPSPEGSRREEQQEIREQRAEERHERLSEVRKTRIRAYWEQMARRLAASIERHERIADKIDSRIAKFEEKSVDVSVAKAKLAEGRAQLVNAENALEDAEVAVEELLASDDPKSIFPKVRDQVKSVRGEIKEAHQLLVDAIASLRAVKDSAEDEDTD